MFTPASLVDPNFQLPCSEQLNQIITEHYITDENTLVQGLVNFLASDNDEQQKIAQHTGKLVENVRQKAAGGEGIEAFLQQYSLDTQEGILLMCLAEALLRIPDAGTADALIKDKLSVADWRAHLKNSDSLLVNASTWGLMLTGKVIQSPNYDDNSDGQTVLSNLLNKFGEPIVRKAMYAAMKIMGKQFVLGRTIKEAIQRSTKQAKAGYTHSYDMLGEAALTELDANKYFQAYYDAITEMANRCKGNEDGSKATISIKLSALHPRYEEAQRARVLSEMKQRLVSLITHAKHSAVGINIDAEEADRLELSLALFEGLLQAPEITQWGQLGFVVQAYSKRAMPVLMLLTQLAKRHKTTIPIRLVKGAYWDYEIKHAQQLGIDGYPVFTRKAGTDASYLACSKYLLSEHTRDCLFPQFATHNAQTVCSILAMAGDRAFEFQRLHGMGEALYDTLLQHNPTIAVRIYAPVGAHQDLLPYLVRRLLENGANSSFVHKLVDPGTPLSMLTAHPVSQLQKYRSFANQSIKLPPALFSDRANSKGVNLTVNSQRDPLLAGINKYLEQQWTGYPLIDGINQHNPNSIHPVTCPHQRDKLMGHMHWSDPAMVDNALASAQRGYLNWRSQSIESRARALENMATKIEQNQDELLTLCCLEAGKTIEDGISEIREAIDFCRYYALQGRQLCGETLDFEGPTGETNRMSVQGKGVFVCISPWNFPFAIFLGQVVAAVITGNSVIAKPAEQTSLIAHRCVELLHESGVPTNVVQLVPGDGANIGQRLISDPRVAGVCFTGSTVTAKHINLALAQRDGAIATLIAETGGQNAMIVDSTSLPEQVVTDVVTSAFSSAGQRCSALRVLYVQADIADSVITLLKGAMECLVIGNPLQLSTDVGPVIDKTAKEKLLAHIATLRDKGQVIAEMSPTAELENGNFVMPTVAEIDHIKQLDGENFGPILHIVRYQANTLEQIIEQINQTGFGLTLGIHSRNESLAAAIAERVNVGNIYINRNQIGATVGVQPFGGQGLSGTGPKAGGPHYLSRFINEKTVSNNITSIGGNTQLLRMGEQH